MTTRVSVTVGRTINIGNYESIRMDFTMNASLKEGETSAAAWDRIQKKVEDRLDAESAKIEHMMDNKSSFKKKPK